MAAHHRRLNPSEATRQRQMQAYNQAVSTRETAVETTRSRNSAQYTEQVLRQMCAGQFPRAEAAAGRVRIPEWTQQLTAEGDTHASLQ